MLKRLSNYNQEILDSYYDEQSNSQVIVVKNGEEKLQLHSDEELIEYVKGNIQQMNQPQNSKKIITDFDISCNRNLGDFPDFFDTTFGDFIKEIQEEREDIEM